MAPTVVILGGSHAGILIAHKLLKHTLTSVKDLKVILVNPSSHFFWNLATVRAVVPGLIADQELFRDIAPGFKYAGAAFEFVQGVADNVDISARTVAVSTAAGAKTLSYDHLVVATGSNTIGKVPWKANALDFEAIKLDLHETQERVRNAKSIVVGGAGTTGVELAGELGFEYKGSKDVTLITSGATVLTGTSFAASSIKAVENTLEKLSVKITTNAKIVSSTTTASGQTELNLSNGTTVLTDLYLPTIGQTGSTSFLPRTLTNDNGEVKVDLNLAVKGVKDIWAAGDVVDIQRSGWMITQAQSEALSKNLDLALKGKPLVPYALPAAGKDMIAVSVGRNKGVGHMNGWKLPSIAIYFAKVKTLGTQNVEPWVTGSKF